MKKQIALVAALLLASSSAIAFDVPNTFVSGDTAVAADVNENFTTLNNNLNTVDAKADTNAADIATNTAAISSIQPELMSLYDGAANYIGKILTAGDDQTVTLYVPEVGRYIKVFAYGDAINSFGRIATSPSDKLLHFTSTDCSGTAYTTISDHGVLFIHTLHFQDDINPLYYTVKMTPTTQVSVNSYLNQNEVCTTSSSVQTVHQVDEFVTLPFTLPLAPPLSIQ